MTIVAMTAACGGAKQESPKVLVLYYSQTGNTKMVAEEIANRLGADIEAIECVNPYDGDFQSTIERCMQEREQQLKPVIQPIQADLSKYDVIFLGYPVWFGTYAPPVDTWLTSTDLSGKKIVPFCTFGSGGLESSARDLVAAQPNAEVLAGYGVRAARLDAMPAEVDQFLKANGFVEGEYVKLPDFPEQHEVSAEETTVFDAAVDGYPMLHAQAKAVATRTLPDGVEYLFTALDTQYNIVASDTTPTEIPIQVYVTVLNGAAPVFTRVVR